MKILLTGHKGYIGCVAGPILQTAGHDVVGLDSDLFAGCDFGAPATEIRGMQKDLRDVSQEDLRGFDAVVNLAALSNDPLGNLDPKLTYDINHLASVRLARLSKAAGVGRFVQDNVQPQTRRDAIGGGASDISRREGFIRQRREIALNKHL